ncbi:MAG TPA: DNA polymerase I [Tenericutes bacterium]|nr:DNA polymerase I [Mycoplasmatota bacterium]
MKKIILVDGNNLLFRSYYATAYTGNMMKNSKGFPTNALFGFTNMINKIINEEQPSYMIVAFDKGKTFRHDKYENYKDGRSETPEELKIQFPIAKEMLEYMGIKYYEIDNYEADDIIGTFAKFCDIEPDFIGTIVSSDKDLLQLISDDIDIKLLKQKDYIRYDKSSFVEQYGIEPINIIDLKALMGDASDNIPGVKGVGEKTALKLLQEYKTLDNIYSNIDKIPGKLKEKLIADKNNAYLSYELATIFKDVPLEINIDNTILKEKNSEKLIKIYEELEFYSFLKEMDKKNTRTETNLNVKIIDNLEDIKLNEKTSVYLEILGNNYHNAIILGMGIYNNNFCGYLPFSKIKKNIDVINKLDKITYDLKKLKVSLKWNNIEIDNISFDTMIAAYLLDYNVKDDIAYLANSLNYNIDFYENIYGKNNKLQIPSEDVIAAQCVNKAKFIYDSYNEFEDKLKKEDMMDLYQQIEHPLASVLSDMEINGVFVNKDTLVQMGEEIKIKLEIITNSIYNHAGCEFNISSPSQLGDILFERLGLPHGKKGKTGYSTAADVLQKLEGKHPIINQILEYRMLTKLYSTYVEGLISCIMDDGKIHTIYNQTLTRTGRLSSIEPNLQNIPIRYEYGRLIRKAFVPSNDSIILSADYSQIELRILAHIADVESLKSAFINEVDIHTKTASDIFGIDPELVTKEQRRIAKAVNFGIIYGISSFGLSENLNINPKQANEFINNYLTMYPGIKKYMDDTIKQAHELGYVKTMFNRKRNIPELDNKNFMIRTSGERMALNTPIQGTSADIIKKAMIDVYNLMKDNNLKSKMILQVHDELVFDILNNEKEIMIEIIKKAMENACSLSVPLKIEIEYGNNWYQAK